MQNIRLPLYFLVALCGTLTLAWFFPFFFDDAFIAFRIGRNLLETGLPYFHPGEAVYTSTSLLYPLWNLIPGLLHPGAEWFRLTPFLNGTLLALASAIALKKAEWGSFHIVPFLAGALISLTLLWDYSILCYGNSGLETALYMVFLAWVVLPGRDGSARTILSGLGPWIRPDGWLALLPPLVMRPLPPFRIWRWTLLLALLSLGLALYWYGGILPQSIPAKANHDTDRMLEIRKGWSYAFFGGRTALFALFVLAWMMQPAARKPLYPLLAWMGAYLTGFSFLASWWPWYLPPLMVGFWFLGIRSVWIVWHTPFRIPGFASRNPVLFAGLAITLFTGGQSLEHGLKNLEKASDAYRIREAACREIGREIDRLVPEKSAVMMEQIGLIGWFSHRRLMDYPGLTQPEMSRFLRDRGKKIPSRMTDPETNEAILCRFRPEFILVSRPEREAMILTRSFPRHYETMAKMAYYPTDPRSDTVWLCRRKTPRIILPLGPAAAGEH